MLKIPPLILPYCYRFVAVVDFCWFLVLTITFVVQVEQQVVRACVRACVCVCVCVCVRTTFKIENNDLWQFARRYILTLHKTSSKVKVVVPEI